MISSVSFIPAGAADPRPKRYQMSSGEAGMLSALAAEDNQEISSPATESQETKKSVQLEKVDISELPADLRMDEYSDDEQNIGELLVGKGSEVSGRLAMKGGITISMV